jgi:urea transporter
MASSFAQCWTKGQLDGHKVFKENRANHDSKMSGALFLVAVAWAPYAAGAPHVAIGRLVAVIVATLTARWLRHGVPCRWSLRLQRRSRRSRTGDFPRSRPVALGSRGAGRGVGRRHARNRQCDQTIGRVRPDLSIRAHNVASSPRHLWVLRYGFSGLAGAALPSGGTVAALEPVAASPLKAGEFAQGVLLSISQVFLKGSAVAALLLLAGLAANSLAAAFALAGAIVAVLAAHVLGAQSELITGGLLGSGPDGNRARHGLLPAGLRVAA